MVTKMEKTLQKLMTKAVYGKTMENLRNKIDVKFVSNKKDIKIDIKMDIKTKLHIT